MKIFYLISCFVFFLSSPAGWSQSDTTVLWQSIRDASEQNDTLALSRANYKLGMYFDQQNNPEESNKYLIRALDLAKAVNNKRAIGIIINYLASNYSEQGRHMEVISLYQQAYLSLIESRDSVAAANVLMNLGATYSESGQLDEALRVEIEALKIRDEVGDSVNIALYYQQIGELYKSLGQNEKWKEYLFKANALAANPDYASFETRIAILNDLGGYYQHEHQLRLAEDSYQQMFDLSRAENYMRGIMVYLTNIVPIYKAQGRYDDALNSALESYRLAESQKKLYNMMSAGNVVASLYLDMKQFDESGIWYQRVMNLSGGDAFVNERARTLLGQTELCKARGDWKLALEYFEKYHLLKDSLESTDLKMRMAEMETRYQTEKKEAQISLLNSKNDLQEQQIKMNHLVTVGILIFSVFILGVILLLLWQSRIRAKAREMELEHKWLRTQMNPHFLFNALGSIQSFIYKKSDDKAIFFLTKFASLTRAILLNSRKDLIPLSEEIDSLQNYIEIEKMRLDACFTYNINYPEELEIELINIPPMLVQPFIENAIKHGFNKSKENCHLELNFSEDGDRLRIEIRDNGIGINQTQNDEKHESMALRIFMERKKLIEKRMKHKIQLSITDLSETEPDQHGTLVEITLPIPE